MLKTIEKSNKNDYSPSYKTIRKILVRGMIGLDEKFQS